MRSFANPALLCWVLAQILILQAAAHDPGSSEKVTAASRAQEGSASAAAELPVSSNAEPSSSEGTVPAAEAPGVRRMGKHKSDKSVAGGGVIIGGLVTAIFAAVFCYIRVTRKRGGVY